MADDRPSTVSTLTRGEALAEDSPKKGLPAVESPSHRFVAVILDKSLSQQRQRMSAWATGGSGRYGHRNHRDLDRPDGLQYVGLLEDRSGRHPSKATHNLRALQKQFPDFQLSRTLKMTKPHGVDSFPLVLAFDTNDRTVANFRREPITSL